MEQVAAGSNHTLAIKTDGSLWATGWNDYGQLGDGTTTDKRSFVEVMAPPPLYTATNAVIEAEQLQTQASVDAARSLVVALPNGADKMALGLRLDDIQEMIDYRESVAIATQLVVTAEASMLQSDIDAAGVAVQALPDGADKTGLISRIAVVQDEIVADMEIQVSAIDSNSSLEDIAELRMLVNSLPESSEKTAMLQALDAQQQTIENNNLLASATSAVVLAETEKTQSNIGAAQVLVTGLPSSADKALLQERLNAVQMYVDAETAVGMAEGAPTQEAVDAASVLVGVLPEGADKTALGLRLDAVQALLEIAFAEQAVMTAEASLSQTDLDFAQLLVLDLADGSQKDGLQTRLNAVQEAITAAINEGMQNKNDTVVVNAFINPTITLALDTYVIDFNASDPTQASFNKPAALGMTVQSNNTYRIMVRALDDFKTGGETPLVMSADHLKAKASTSADFLAMSKDVEVVLLQDQPNTGGIQYELDFRFDSDWQMKPGAYSTTIKITASQL